MLTEKEHNTDKDPLKQLKRCLDMTTQITFLSTSIYDITEGCEGRNGSKNNAPCVLVTMAKFHKLRFEFLILNGNILPPATADDSQY